MRTLNFVFILVTGLVCVGLYRVAEATRVAHVNLAATEHAIAQEHDTLIVLGAEWARVTQPVRIQALADRYLDLADAPSVELSSLALLPRKGAPLANTPLRNAKAEVPAPATPAERFKTIAFRTGM